MKRFVSIVCFILIAFFQTNVFAANAVVTSNFFTLVSDIESNASNYEGTLSQWTLKFNYDIEDDIYSYFSAVNPIVEPISNTYLSVSPYGDWYMGNEYRGQCAGLVKVATNGSIGGTGAWGKGSPFNPSSPPVKGSILAFFNGKTTYSGETGHALVYWGKIGSIHYVIDQNWYFDKKIMKRPMSTTGSGKNSLSNYNIVTY